MASRATGAGVGTVVAVGGGSLSDTIKINRLIVELAEKQHPKLLFIPTASGDNTD